MALSEQLSWDVVSGAHAVFNANRQKLEFGMSDPSQRPAAEGIEDGHFAPSVLTAGHTSPCPARIRGMIDGEWVIDSTSVIHYWEHPYYPQYLVPLADIRSDALPNNALTAVDDTRPGHRLVSWRAVDHWFEEEQEVFVHPRSPYVRADAVRSNRPVLVEVGGAVLADAPGSVIVFETGLPPRYYLHKTTIDWSLLTPTNTVSSCPYKGTTSGYWDANVDGERTTDIAWAYDFPVVAVGAIAGLVAFYNDKVQLTIG